MPLITTVSLLGNRLSQLIYVTSVPNGEGNVKARKLILTRRAEKADVSADCKSIFYVVDVNG